MIELMRELGGGGRTMALLTNNVREWEPRWRAMLPVDEIFGTVVDSAFVGCRKPDPEIYGITLERIGARAARTASSSTTWPRTAPPPVSWGWRRSTSSTTTRRFPRSARRWGYLSPRLSAAWASLVEVLLQILDEKDQLERIGRSLLKSEAKRLAHAASAGATTS